MSFWLCILLAAAWAMVEAILWSRRGAECFEGNEHVFLVAQRGLMVLSSCGAVADVLTWATWPVLAAQLVAFVLAFSFVHNNTYNFGRVWIDWVAELRKHPEDAQQAFETEQLDRLALKLAWQRFRWNYQSASSSARFDFSAPERNAQAVGGLVVYGLSFLLPHWRPAAWLILLIGFGFAYHLLLRRAT